MDLARCFDVIAEVATFHGVAAPEPLGPDERAAVLDLARVVAHGVERSAAPLACYAVGRVLGASAPEARLDLLRAIIDRVAAESADAQSES